MVKTDETGAPAAPEGEPPEEQRRYLQAILGTMRQPLVVLGGGLHVETANDAFYTTFEVSPEETEGRLIYELGNGQWDIPDLRKLLEEILPGNGEVTDFKVEHEFERIGRRVMILNAQKLERGSRDDRILFAIDDVTEREDLTWELEGQKEFAEKIIDASRDPLLVLDPDLRVQNANETFYNTFKVDPSETEGRLVYELGKGQWDIPRLRELLEEVLPDNDTFDDFEVEHEFDEIGRRVMVLNARKIDHTQTILLAIEDQTEAHRATASLRESEQRYRTLFEAIDEGFCIIEMLFDERDNPIDYRFLEFNPAFVRHTGLADAVGRRMRELAPEHEQHWFDTYGRIALTGEPERFEHAARQLGGRWYDVYAFRVGVPEDRRVAVIFRDIADRKAAEAALHESEQRFRVLVETTARAVWEADAEGMVVEDSPSWRAFTGQTTEEWMGDGWRDAVHPDDREHAESQWRESTATDRHFDAEFRLRRAEGGWRWTHVRAAPVRDDDGRVLKWVGMNTDISSRKEAEEQRELLLGELNHRVKNIFAVIRSLASQSDGERSAGEFREAFVGRLDALIRAHKLALDSRWESIHLARLADETLRPYAADRRDAVEIDGPSLELPPRTSLSLGLVLHELATNAVKYGALSRPEGRVRLSWGLRDDGATLRLEWRETRGPPASAPERPGFGTRLVSRVFEYELGGGSELQYREEGFRLAAWFPLD